MHWCYMHSQNVWFKTLSLVITLYYYLLYKIQWSNRWAFTQKHDILTCENNNNTVSNNNNKMITIWFYIAHASEHAAALYSFQI